MKAVAGIDLDEADACDEETGMLGATGVHRCHKDAVRGVLLVRMDEDRRNLDFCEHSGGTEPLAPASGVERFSETRVVITQCAKAFVAARG